MKHLLSLSTVLILLTSGCNSTPLTTGNATQEEQETLIQKSTCARIHTTPSRMFLSNACAEPRAITIRWAFSNSNTTKDITYRIGSSGMPLHGKREILFRGTTATIINDTDITPTMNTEAANWIHINNGLYGGSQYLLVENGSRLHVFVTIKSIIATNPNPIDTHGKPFTDVLPPLSPPIPIDQNDKPLIYKLITAEYEPE